MSMAMGRKGKKRDTSPVSVEEELKKSKQELEKKVREFVQAEEKSKQQLEKKEEELKKCQQELEKKAKELVQAEEKCFSKLKTKEKENRKSNENVQELKKALSKKEEELEKQNEKVVKHEKLVAVLEERLECPVCLDIPTTGPIYTCSNGHCICSACYQGKASNCPVCRSTVAKTCELVSSFWEKFPGEFNPTS